MEWMLAATLSLKRVQQGCIAACALLLFSGGANAESPGPVTLKVYAHASVTARNLSTDELRAIFSMRVNRWPDGRRLQVFVLPDNHALHRRFSKEVLGVFPYQLRAGWDRAVFSGTGRAPVEVSDAQQMLNALRETPGAVGYLPNHYQEEALVDVRD